MRNLFTLITMFIFSSCNQTQSEQEKDYIKNLEEKNRALQTELQEEKDKLTKAIERTPTPIYVPQEIQKEKNVTKDYFTIGSSEDDVLEVMGDPTNIINFESIEMKEFSYGMSSVSFKNGKVEGYNNFEKNLKVKVKK